MAAPYDVTLRQGEAAPNDVRLYPPDTRLDATGTSRGSFKEFYATLFHRSNETPLSENSFWTSSFGESTFNLVGLAAAPNTVGADCGTRFIGYSIPNDQYIRARLFAVGASAGDAGVGFYLRMQEAARTNYRITFTKGTSNNINIDRVLANTFATIGSVTFTWVDGDEFTASIEGQIIRIFDKTRTVILTVDDSGNGGPTTGQPGLCYSASMNSVSVDDVSIGSFTTTAVPELSITAPTARLSNLTPHFVNHIRTNGAGTSQDSASFDSTGYNYIVCFSKYEGTQSALTITDNKGTVFSNLTLVRHSNNDVEGQMSWAKIGTPGAGHIVTQTYGGSQPFRSLVVWLVSASSGLLLEAQSTGSGTSTATFPVGASILTTDEQTVSFMAVGEYDTVTYTPQYGWTEDLDAVIYGASRAGSDGVIYPTVLSSALMRYVSCAASFSNTLLLDAGANTITLSAPVQSQLAEITLAAGVNTITLSAPAQSQVVAITVAAGSNTITLSAPTQSQSVTITLAAGSNTITLSAPAQSEVHAITLAAVSNTITLSAPAQSEVHAITLAAGSNIITVSAPAQSETHAITLAAGANTTTLSAPAQSQSVTITRAAGANTITLSAPTVPSLVLTMPVSTNTITLTAPAQSQLVELTLAAGSNTITLSAPTIPAIILTMPVSTCTVTLTAPAQSQLAEITLAAGSNTITLTAPAQTELHAVTLAAGTNEVMISAPAQSQVVEVSLIATTNIVTLSAPVPILVADQFIVAIGNLITVSAPDPVFIYDQVLLAGSNTLADITAPDATLLVGVQYDGSGNITFTFAPAPALTVTAPIAELVEQGKFLAGPNTIRITAPVATIPVTLAAVANLLTVSAPDATLLVGVQFYENWLLQSEDMDAVYPPWAPEALSVVQNAALAPDGTMTAEKLVDSAVSLTHALNADVISTMPDVTVAVFSIFLKAAEYDTAQIDFFDDAPTTGYASADYTLTGSGTAIIDTFAGFDGDDGVRQSAGIENVGGGWYRCWIAIGMLLAGSSHVTVYPKDDTHVGDISKGLYAWGAQINRDSISPSPYLRSGSEVLSSTVFTFAPAPALTITAPVAQFLDLDQLLIADASHITFEAPLAILSKRMGVLKARAVARITVRKAYTAALVTRTTPYEAPVAALKAQSTLLMVSEPLDAKLGLVVSSSEIVVG